MSKYHAIKTTIDGITFASRAEAERYQVLKIIERAGHITDLTLQPKFPVVINGKKVCIYVADFQYVENGKTVVEDVKGVKTPVYQLKKKLIKAVYGFDILETTKGKRI